jgi:hypothetical protein
MSLTGTSVHKRVIWVQVFEVAAKNLCPTPPPHSHSRAGHAIMAVMPNLSTNQTPEGSLTTTRISDPSTALRAVPLPEQAQGGL